MSAAAGWDIDEMAAPVEARVPSHDLDAEAAVLSAVMNDRLSFGKVAEFLRPEHFYSEAHRRIFEACVAVAPTVPGAPDIVSVASWLRAKDRLQQVGGMAYMTTVLNAAPGLANVLGYAGTVYQKSVVRRRTELSGKLQELGYGASDPALAEAIVAELAALSAPAAHLRADIDPADPLRGLPLLQKLALVGRDRIRELAARPISYLWDGIVSAGQITLVASGPGEGKTTLLGLCIAARLNLGDPVQVLGRRVTPAPAGQYIVWIQAEHGEGSAARKAVRSCRALCVDDACLDRLLILARKDVRLGSPAWKEVECLVAAGLVSDIVIDTLARVAPGDANDEQQQAEAFAIITTAIELAPSTDKPVAWVAAHTRKSEGQKSLADVSGSTQRTGQVDTAILLDATRADGGKVLQSRAIFAKLREDPDDDWPSPVTFSVSKGPDGAISYRCDAAVRHDDDAPLEERIVRLLEVGPQTKNAISAALRCNKDTVEDALTNLFTARRIRSTRKKVGGRDFKAFELDSGAPNGAPNGASHRNAPNEAPDEHRTPLAGDA
jgi:hypothetical protein